MHTNCVFLSLCVCVWVHDCVCILSLSLSLSGPVCVSQQGWYGFGSTRLFRSSFERWGWASQRKADSDHHRAQWIQPHYIHPTPRSTPCPRTTHANTTPLAHTIKMPNKLRQAHSHTRMQTHQPLHICSSSHIHAHKLTQHPSMSPEYVNIYTKNTLLWRHAMHSRQIKVAPLYFINKWPSFYCV